MTRLLALTLLAMACGGQADAATSLTPDVDAGARDAVNVDVPLCEGEDDWQPGECQRLVHSPRTGYCNRWIPCDEL